MVPLTAEQLVELEELREAERIVASSRNIMIGVFSFIGLCFLTVLIVVVVKICCVKKKGVGEMDSEDEAVEEYIQNIQPGGSNLNRVHDEVAGAGLDN